MDRPDAHRPTGARQHDPGSVGGPFGAAPGRHSARDLGAPPPRRVTATADSDTGPRHRLGGGPRTPAGIPVISLPPVPALNMGTKDGYATDRLPIVGGPLDPGAHHALADIPSPAPTHGSGPATERFPTSTDTAFGHAPGAGTHAPDAMSASTGTHTPVPSPAPTPAPGSTATDPRPAAPAPTARQPRVPSPARVQAYAPATSATTRAPMSAPAPARIATDATRRHAPAATPAPISPRGHSSTPARPAPHGLTPSPTPAAVSTPVSWHGPAATYESAPTAAAAPAAVHAPTTPRASTAASQAPAASATDPDSLLAQHDPDPSRPAPDYGGDDEVFVRMINRSKRRRPPRWAAPLAASMAGALLIGGGYFQLRGPAPESAAASSPIGAGSAPAPSRCPAEQVGSRIQGNGPGGTENGVAAILAFQHAYYVARSGDQARTLVSKNSDLPSGADIQAGIDTIPAGTTHCLSITPAADAGQYFVEITEFRPDEVPITYNPQLVGTAEVGGKYLITSIGPAR
ncbi:hypothetical protein [Nocardia rhizosphaerae]|uniref:DUF8176 domain-containing protein n=1 Tax=Nocardia rhizosphaerae TaxID=1691571 RepID=A0ABV8LEJ9_9NOCA